MRYRALFGLVLALFLKPVEIGAQNDFRVMFYNVENLFDTKDDLLKNDDDFLPDGFMRWTPWKYWEKLRDITRVVTAVGEMQSPALIGLCEVENDSVMHDLTRRSPLRAQEYEYLITHSPDERGINVALLYQRHQFKLLESAEYEVRFNHPENRPTRNILHAVGELVNGSILDVFVCHFPSRSGGQLETEPARVESASLLKEKVDSVLLIRATPYCILMGDFNDPPNSKCLNHTLKSIRVQPPFETNKLYNLFFEHSEKRDIGSYKYQGKWEVIDQFIVNGNLLMDERNVRVKNREAFIFNGDFLLEDDDKYYGTKPYRTNLGPRYHGGFSDHLPIFLDVVIEN